MNFNSHSILRLILFGLILFTSACAPKQTQPTPDLTLTAVFKSALLTATYSVPTVTPTPTPTATPTLTPTPIRTPPTLPTPFASDLLNPVDSPHTYIENTCQYLKSRWDPNNSAPGTVVMPIMFHSITDGEINHEFQIKAGAVTELLNDLKNQGFETITADQLAAFLQHNAKIPPRSVLLIVDDLKTDEYYRKHFVPVLQEYHWTVTNAWISEPEASKRVRDGNVALQNEGWVDHQAHGVIHNINITEFKPGTLITTDLYGTISAEQFVHNEIEGSMKAVTETFGKAPVAYIWPGGNFSALGVKVAREAGFQIGFTVNPRGPIMFNWVPLSEKADPNRPSFNSEGYIKDPLMVLPRYWDIDAATHLDAVRQIGKQAAEYAQTNKQTELDYYDIVCKNTTGEIPPLVP
jgi:hypothetical protein